MDKKADMDAVRRWTETLDYVGMARWDPLEDVPVPISSIASVSDHADSPIPLMPATPRISFAVLHRKDLLSPCRDPYVVEPLYSVTPNGESDSASPPELMPRLFMGYEPSVREDEKENEGDEKKGDDKLTSSLATCKAFHDSLVLNPEVDPPAQVPVLSTINLRSTPLNHHAISLSCDGELAVAADDSVHILLPEFVTPDDPVSKHRSPDGDDARAELKTEQYHTYRGQFMAIKKPDPRANINLFRAAGLPMDDFEEHGVEEPYRGHGSGLPTGFGGSINQTVALEWSPSGAGHNLRPVLAVLLTSGSVLVYGEDPNYIDDCSTRAKSFDAWKILWGVGGVLPLPLPDPEGPGGFNLPHDKIKSFSWAHHIGTGRVLMAYATDASDIVVLMVQYAQMADTTKSAHPQWKVEEVARFQDHGPHPLLSVTDPDFVPFGSAFSLKWSPWVVSGDFKIAVLARIQRSYVGFRRISVPLDWERNDSVPVRVDPVDLMGICTNTLNDAFVAFENAVWTVGEQKVCRGVIASPFVAKPFEIVLNAPLGVAVTPHSSNDCGTAYPAWQTDSANPITSLCIHAPCTLEKNAAPSFSLVRLSATATNSSWYQHFGPAGPSGQANGDAEEGHEATQWAVHIDSNIRISVPVTMASREADSDSEGGGDGGGAGGGGSDDEEDVEDDFEMPEEAGEQVHPWRMRIWGLTASAGGGMTAVLISQHSNLGPERKARTKIAFGWDPRRRGARDDVADGTDDARRLFLANLTTEGRVWEWMYGGGPAVPGSVGDPHVEVGHQALRGYFEGVIGSQRCVLCRAALNDTGRYTICEMNHSFATCAATGVAILAPGISRACGICGRRTLLGREIERMAEEAQVSVQVDDSLVEACPGCGGKFIA